MRACRWLAASLALAAFAGGAACSGASDGGIDGPSTWRAIYADYLAPDASAGCGGTQSGCHSNATDTGAIVSNFVCADQATCYTSLTMTSGLLIAEDQANPSGSKFITDLRQDNGSGKMPKDSTFVFQAIDLARIDQWVKNGAHDD